MVLGFWRACHTNLATPTSMLSLVRNSLAEGSIGFSRMPQEPPRGWELLEDRIPPL